MHIDLKSNNLIKSIKYSRMSPFFGILERVLNRVIVFMLRKARHTLFPLSLIEFYFDLAAEGFSSPRNRF